MIEKIDILKLDTNLFQFLIHKLTTYFNYIKNIRLAIQFDWKSKFNESIKLINYCWYFTQQNSSFILSLI